MTVPPADIKTEVVPFINQITKNAASKRNCRIAKPLKSKGLDLNKLSPGNSLPEFKLLDTKGKNKHESAINAIYRLITRACLQLDPMFEMQ